MNWEEMYWDLVGSIALEKAEKARKKRKKEDEAGTLGDDPFFKNSIAPKSMNLPNIMTMATPRERQKIIKSVMEKIKEGKWCGAWIKGHGKQKRPGYAMWTERANEEVAAGTRKSKYTKSAKKKHTGYVSFLPYHCVLLHHGFYPTEQKSVCSHICHDPSCVRIDHIMWSSHDDNYRRERLCNKEKRCVCGLDPPCDFTLHPEAHKK